MQPDRLARQKIAEGPTDEDLRAGKDDPELRSLKAAQARAFPATVDGRRAGAGPGICPEAVGKVGPEVITQGTRPVFDRAARTRKRSRALGRALAEEPGDAQFADRTR